MAPESEWLRWGRLPFTRSVVVAGRDRAKTSIVAETVLPEAHHHHE